MSPTTHDSNFEGLWLSSAEEALWRGYSEKLSDQLMLFTSVMVLTHIVLQLLVSIMSRKSSLAKDKQEIFPILFLGAAHAIFCMVSGVVVTWGPNSPLNRKMHLLGFSTEHAFVASVNVSYGLCSCFFYITKPARFGWRAVATVIGKASLLAIFTYFNLVYPCLLGIKVWEWWNMTELGSLAVIVVKMVIMSKMNPKVKVGIFMSGMALTMGCLWVSGYLVLWLHWWLTANEMYDLPSEYPAKNLTKIYFYATMGSAIGWAFLSYVNFKEALGLTKKWSETMKSIRRSKTTAETEETKKTT